MPKRVGRVPQLCGSFHWPQNWVQCPHLKTCWRGNAMVSHHFVSQLIRLALLWLFVILHLSWPKRAVTAPAVPTEAEPLQPKRSRSNEPKPFEGLTHKPPCALCARDTAYPK